MEFTGRIKVKINRSGNKKSDGTPFTSFDYLIEQENERYPESIIANAYGDKIPEMSEGSLVKVNVSLEARAWNDKFFQSIRIWKAEVLDGVTAPAPAPEAPSAEGCDDLPF